MTADFFKNYVNIEFSYLLCTHLVIYYTFLFAVVAYSTYGVECDKDISLKISYSADFFRFCFVSQFYFFLPFFLSFLFPGSASLYNTWYVVVDRRLQVVFFLNTISV